MLYHGFLKYSTYTSHIVISYSYTFMKEGISGILESILMATFTVIRAKNMNNLLKNGTKCTSLLMHQTRSTIHRVLRFRVMVVPLLICVITVL